jgi:hypothetical protein
VPSHEARSIFAPARLEDDFRSIVRAVHVHPARVLDVDRTNYERGFSDFVKMVSRERFDSDLLILDVHYFNPDGFGGPYTAALVITPFVPVYRLSSHHRLSRWIRLLMGGEVFQEVSQELPAYSK